MTDWARTARLAAAALVRAEAESLARIRRAARRATEALVGRLAMLPDDSRRQAAAAAIHAVREALPMMIAAVSEAVRSGRLGAKSASTFRLQIEWDAVRRSLDQAGFEVPARLVPLPVDEPEDEAEADLAAQSYASAWGAAMMAAIWKWSESETGSLTRAATETTAALDYRLRRIATTETTKAFADARDDGMGWVAEHHGEAKWFPLLVKAWDATLDRKVCPTCSELDGKTRPWGTPFPGGAEPGYVHANCRCVPVTQLLPLPMRGERIQGRQVDDERPREAS